jgi:hypothetical protein
MGASDNDIISTRSGIVVEPESISLENDKGGPVTFRGALYAQTSFYDEDTGILTQQRLYTTCDGDQAFSIVSSDGVTKSRRAYVVRREGEMCHIQSGDKTVTIPYDSLMLFTRVLWDIDLDQKGDAMGEFTIGCQTVNE